MRYLVCLVVSILMLAQVAFAQNGEIRGRVTDEAGDPLPGAQVSLVGTSMGAITNVDGEFVILRYCIDQIRAVRLLQVTGLHGNVRFHCRYPMHKIQHSLLLKWLRTGKRTQDLADQVQAAPKDGGQVPFKVRLELGVGLPALWVEAAELEC